MLFVEKRYIVQEKRDRVKNGKYHSQFKRDEPCA